MAQEAGATRAAIRRIREKQPDITATEISRLVGVTRERVRQHLWALGLPTRTGRSLLRLSLDEQPQRKQHVHPSRVITGGVPVHLSAITAGVVGELLAAADLTARGYTVYAPICRHAAHADLIALRRGREDAPLTFEVRCGRLSPRGEVKYAVKAKSKTNHHAIVVTGQPVSYQPDLPE